MSNKQQSGSGGGEALHYDTPSVAPSVFTQGEGWSSTNTPLVLEFEQRAGKYTCRLHWSQARVTLTLSFVLFRQLLRCGCCEGILDGVVGSMSVVARYSLCGLLLDQRSKSAPQRH